jgi:16S rRNA G966 N2-methylase RsmD
LGQWGLLQLIEVPPFDQARWPLGEVKMFSEDFTQTIKARFALLAGLPGMLVRYSTMYGAIEIVCYDWEAIGFKIVRFDHDNQAKRSNAQRYTVITMLYSGDKPNPFLQSFVEAHLKSHLLDPHWDEYHVEEFAQPIETTKNSPIYSMHGYHLGKKPYNAIEAYIRHYTEEGDLILDPFCGSGGTALAALINGRKAIAIDASPAATFITRFYLSQCDPDDLVNRFQALCSRIASEMEYLYGTICHRCGGSATIHYVIYSNVYECPGCGKRVSFYEASSSKPSKCPGCETSITPYLGTCGCEPVAVNFSCHGRCSPKRTTRSTIGPPEDRTAFQQIDVPRIMEIDNQPIPYPYPQQFMMNVQDPDAPWGDEWRPSRNFRRVADLFTTRNLRALAAFMHTAGDDDDLRALITSGMFAVSRKAQHLTGGGGYIPGNWALPPMSKQRNVLESLTTVFSRTLKAKRALKNLLKSQDACISTQSAVWMTEIPSCSVDYIFTDPPYGGTVQYGELNFVWEAWLGLNTDWRDDEIIVNNSRNKSLQDWADMMLLAISECFRVLKPGRWLSLCYHDSSAGTWRHIQDIMAKAGFVPGDSERALFIDTGSNTYNQRVTDKLVKRDLVINFRKPGNGEKPKFVRIEVRTADFDALAESLIAGYLAKHPGSAKDRVYDHVVNALVRRGCMQDHNFEKVLKRVAREDGKKNKWYLRNAQSI